MNSISTFEIAWQGIPFTGTAIYTPGDPGRTYGPPEKCYPPEPSEVQILSLIHTVSENEKLNLIFLIDTDVGGEIYDEVLAYYEQEPDDEPYGMSDVEADADTLKSAGMGTDEDYGFYGDEHES